MDSAEPQQSDSSTDELNALLRKGDHVQVFGGKHDPDTGQPREMMVIWRNNKQVWAGPLVHWVLLDDRVVERKIEIRLPLKLHRDFKVNKNPLTTS